MSPQLERFQAAAELALEQLKREHLVDEFELTLVMRHPSSPECYAVITNDDPEAVARVLLKAKRKEVSGG